MAIGPINCRCQPRSTLDSEDLLRKRKIGLLGRYLPTDEHWGFVQGECPVPRGVVPSSNLLDADPEYGQWPN